MTSEYAYIKAMDFPSQRPEVVRQRYRNRAAEINARNRERYATDPEFRERRRETNRRAYAKRAGK